MDRTERLGYLDGIKAIATVLVFNTHFLNAYYYGIYTLKPEHFHTSAGVEWWIGATPLNLIYAGKAGARVFLGVSAFLAAYGYFRSHSTKKLLFMPVKKYIRLAPPVLLVNTAVYFLMRQGAYYNAQAAGLAGSTEIFGTNNQFAPKLGEAVQEALFGCFMNGGNRYNGPIWFLQYELWGCVLAAAILLAIGRRRACLRWGVYAAAAILLVRTDYLCMVLSLALADLTVERPEPLARLAGWISGRKWILWVIFLAAVYFLTYPSYGEAGGTIYGIFPPKVLFYYNVAIPAVLFCIMGLKPLQRFFSHRSLEKMTRISYFFYLVHFPVLATVSAAFFVNMYGKINYHALAALAYLLTFTASILVSWMLTKWVDKPLQELAGRLEEKWMGRRE